MITQTEIADIPTATGTMRTYIYRPVATASYPTVIFYSEIFQQTAPIARSAAIMAGHGFVVLVPEVFHELNPIGTVLAYDDAGKDKGNQDKFTKPLADHDTDTEAMVRYIDQAEFCNGQIGSMGVCIGGHLAFRAALNPRVKAASCLYATDLHSNTLPASAADQSLARAGEITAELMMVWGRQDPHVPDNSRAEINQALRSAGCHFSWHEFNGQHAFMRDEGERYDAELALTCYRMSVDLFRRAL
ncbi:dienelactone hydrolase family protein [Gilvimarinus agarilyticus]|uniref:dienelactone hydrolase family protein n=1 Tax=unclassified Gilvimarinus TaxID=2642066 RepID=UPI001C08126C|nr:MULTISPECIES: dienelactone hydrolase family protein [unclassified Gilvimarinus]MBU2885033.1 dienelactone hydrolase family protein [Gilvimarinus agarilyticus]MDO6569930.1 dienelactone hydrolase family protein [Gilvimarinus sp. 2_MG-2023]MDO6747139.1 dienelactone hydrolase family protein [Gilvimarinus sp. 1_MG-2023]